MFCMSKKRDRNQSEPNTEQQPKPPQQPKANQQPAKNNERPGQRHNGSGAIAPPQNATFLEQDPLTQACTAFIAQASTPPARKARTARQRGGGGDRTTSTNSGQNERSSRQQSRSQSRSHSREPVAGPMDPSDNNPQFQCSGETLQITGRDLRDVNKYLQFVYQTERELDFSKEAIEELKKVFKKASSKQKLKVMENGKLVERTLEVMNKEQFRSQMGLLGQQSQPFLAHRIFEVFDHDKDEFLNFHSFAMIMDILCNGLEEERNMFGFALMDRNGNNSISFEEFYDYFSQVIAHWSSLVNSNVRVSKGELLEIFDKIDTNGDGTIGYKDYSLALSKNPDLLDWFDLLNSGKRSGPLHQSYAQKEAAEAQRKLEEEKAREEADWGIVKLDKEKIEQIVKLKDVSQEKTQVVNQLTSEMSSMQEHTSEQLQGILKQISVLQDQVRGQLTRREQEKKQWEDSVLLQQQDLTSNFDQFSQLQGEAATLDRSRLGFDVAREQRLNMMLVDDDQDMPFPPSAEANRFRRDDEFQVGQTRQPAMTFGHKQGSATRASFEGQYPHEVMHEDRRNDYDSNTTLKQWQKKGLFQRTNQESNSPTGQSSNYHLSQFNYELQQRNGGNREPDFTGYAKTASYAVVPDSVQDRYMRTQGDENGHIGSQFSEAQNTEYMVTKMRRIDDASAGTHSRNLSGFSLPFNPSHSPRQAKQRKTYEEVMGPEASLNDILNYDFKGRYQDQPHKKAEWRLGDDGKLASALQTQEQQAINDSITNPSQQTISPIFEVLIKLRQGREQAKETVGEKRINMRQVPSKQNLARNQQDQVNQKNFDDDVDDLVLDPDSPINSASPNKHRPLNPSLQSSQTLKVNQRHQRRQEAMRNYTNSRSIDGESVVSSNLNKLSQMQGGGAIDSHNAFQIGQQATSDFTGASQRGPIGSMAPIALNLTGTLQHHANYGLERTLSGMPHANTERKHFQGLAHGQALNTLPHSPVPKIRSYREDQVPIGQLLMNSSVDHDEMLGRQMNLSRSTKNPSNVWAPPQHMIAIVGNKSAHNDDRGMRPEAYSQLSHALQQRAQSIRTVTMPPKPASPKAEKELLSKLDEVNQQVNSWLKDLEKNKKEQQKKAKVRAKSAITRPAQEDESLKVIEELKQEATRRDHTPKKEPPTMIIDTTENRAPKTVSFQEARPTNLLVSTKHSETDDGRGDSERGTFSNAHTALAQVKVKNKSKKDTTFVHFGNDSWNLVLHMLFGIRQSVHSVRYDDVFELTDAEFKSKFRYELEAQADQKIWNVRKYEFYDFSPRMFNLIRKFYGINSNDYLKSIGPETLFGSLNMGKINSLKSQCSAGKSGSLFYYTADGLYMLKTISHDEFEHFKAIMRNYYHHMLAYPHTLITRFYGLHKIKFTRTTRIERVYFVIMANVFNTPQNIQVRYDLKGSLYGRTSRKGGKIPSSTTALKDCDWLEDRRIINIREEQRHLLDQQIKADTKFFQDNNINDYSVLLGITQLRGGAREGKFIVQNSMDFDVLYLTGINSAIEEEKKRKEVKRTQSQLLASRTFTEIDNRSSMAQQRMQSVRVEQTKLQRSDSELLLHERQRPEKAFFESQEGGIVSADGTEIYFMGIIDILTNFGKKKRVENLIRCIVHNPRTISCIPPYQYGERFYTFMTEKVYLTQQKINEELKSRQAGQKSPIFD